MTTYRDIYNKAKAQLLAQNCLSARIATDGGPGFGISKSCAYRGENGAKCAIGALINDEHYRPYLEGKIASDTLVLEGVSLSLDIHADRIVNFLSSLQDTHDMAFSFTHPMDQLKKNLALFEEKYQAELSNPTPLE
jgi:hypothetical protein